MTHYQTMIAEATGCTNATDIAEIEDYMRNVIFNSTLDWQTAEQLNKAAREAWRDLKYMRTPEGMAYINRLQAQMQGNG